MVLQLDLEAAFDNVKPAAAIEALSRRPQVWSRAGRTLMYLLKSGRPLIYRCEGELKTATVYRGIPQGLSLSMLIFDMVTQGAVHEALTAMRQLDPCSHIVTYADDISLIGTPLAVERGFTVISQELVSAGLHVNLAKSSFHIPSTPVEEQLAKDWLTGLPSCVESQSSFSDLMKSTRLPDGSIQFTGPVPTILAQMQKNMDSIEWTSFSVLGTHISMCPPADSIETSRRGS